MGRGAVRESIVWELVPHSVTDPSHCGKRIRDDPVSDTCVTVIDVDLDTKTSSGERCMWATHCKESVHSKGNSRAAFLGFEQRVFFLGQGGGQLLQMPSTEFQSEQGTRHLLLAQIPTMLNLGIIWSGLILSSSTWRVKLHLLQFSDYFVNVL